MRWVRFLLSSNSGVVGVTLVEISGDHSGDGGCSGLCSQPER